MYHTQFILILDTIGKGVKVASKQKSKKYKHIFLAFFSALELLFDFPQRAVHMIKAFLCISLCSQVIPVQIQSEVHTAVV